MEERRHTMECGGGGEMELYVDCGPTLTRCEMLGSLQGLTVVETAFGDDELRALRACESLHRIALLQCAGFDDLGVLGAMATLREIYVHTRGPLRGVDSLLRLPSLRRLRMNCCDVGEREAHMLNGMEALEHLSLSNCDKVIYERRPGCLCSTIITDNNLWDFCRDRRLVKVDFSHSEYLTDVSPLAGMETLEEIVLDGCVGLRDAAALGWLPRLRVLDVSETAIGDDSIRAFAMSRSLVSIAMAHCGNLGDINPLSAIQTLENVSLSDCDNLNCVASLGRLPRLRDLDVSWTKITDDSVRGIGASRSLVNIVMNRCYKITDLSPLAAIQTLKTALFARCGYLHNVGTLGGLPALRELDVTGTHLINDDVRNIAASRSLVRLAMNSDNITDLSHLSNVTTLEIVFLSVCMRLSDVAALGRLPRLRELDVSGNDITDESVRAISVSRSLVKLVMEHCYKITDVSPLAMLQTLEVLLLEDCYNLNNAAALGRLPALRELNVSATKITDECVRGISESRSLVDISLCDCGNITDVSPLAAVQTLGKILLYGCPNLNDIQAVRNSFSENVRFEYDDFDSGDSDSDDSDSDESDSDDLSVFSEY